MVSLTGKSLIALVEIAVRVKAPATTGATVRMAPVDGKEPQLPISMTEPVPFVNAFVATA
jgi:hypothetical protein